jgi:hypothetical protein
MTWNRTYGLHIIRRNFKIPMHDSLAIWLEDTEMDRWRFSLDSNVCRFEIQVFLKKYIFEGL